MELTIREKIMNIIMDYDENALSFDEAVEAIMEFVTE